MTAPLRVDTGEGGSHMRTCIYRGLLGTALALTLGAGPVGAEIIKAEVGVAGMF